jgi:hypothetical protein
LLVQSAEESLSLNMTSAGLVVPAAALHAALQVEAVSGSVGSDGTSAGCAATTAGAA